MHNEHGSYESELLLSIRTSEHAFPIGWQNIDHPSARNAGTKYSVETPAVESTNAVT